MKRIYKAKLDISNDKKSPQICRIFKTKSGHKISKTKGISFSRIREISEIMTKQEKFGLQSLISSGESVAANGISERLIST